MTRAEDDAEREAEEISAERRAARGRDTRSPEHEESPGAEVAASHDDYRSHKRCTHTRHHNTQTQRAAARQAAMDRENAAGRVAAAPVAPTLQGRPDHGDALTAWQTIMAFDGRDPPARTPPVHGAAASRVVWNQLMHALNGNGETAQKGKSPNVGWATSSKDRNRLAHSTNGNGPIDDRQAVISALSSQGITNARAIYDRLIEAGARQMLANMVSSKLPEEELATRITFEATKRAVPVLFSRAARIGAVTRGHPEAHKADSEPGTPRRVTWESDGWTKVEKPRKPRAKSERPVSPPWKKEGGAAAAERNPRSSSRPSRPREDKVDWSSLKIREGDWGKPGQPDGQPAFLKAIGAEAVSQGAEGVAFMAAAEAAALKHEGQSLSALALTMLVPRWVEGPRRRPSTALLSARMAQCSR